MMTNATFAQRSESVAPDAPLPEPDTQSPCGGNGRFEMGLGYDFVKLRSSPINAAMNGLHSSLTYFPKGSMAIEGNATTAFGHEIFDSEHTKFLIYGGGAKYVERRARWDPWAHVLPAECTCFRRRRRVAMNGPAVKFGGGIDYPQVAQLPDSVAH